MNTIIVKNQAEWDALPEKFEELTAVHVYSDPANPLVIKQCPGSSRVVAWGSSSVVAWGSSRVEAWGSSRVEAWESSSVVAWESSRVEAWGSSSVVAWGSSSVEAWGSSRVEAWGSSSVEAWESSSVVAWESSRVVAWGSSSVVAWESSSVVAWESSSVVAWGSSRVEAWGSSSIKSFANALLQLFSDESSVEAWHSVTIICRDCKPSIKRHGTGVTIVHTKTFKHSIKSFCEMHLPDKEGFLTLYKSVRPDTLCDHHTGTIKYEGTVECPDWDPNKDRQCGGGLHLSPTPEDALQYHGDGKVLVCKVAKRDFVVYPTDITKVRCRKVTVIREWKPEEAKREKEERG